jgi:succinate dehydrogenase / fumarate reductase membrane anchor subunit
MRESTFWSLFMVAGLVLFVLLGVHLVGMHLSSLFGISYTDILSFASVKIRGHQGFYFLLYLILLAAALYHGFYGLRTLILELGLKEKTERVISGIVLAIGFLFFLYGTYVLFLALRI